MNYNSFSFNTVDKNGNEFINDIISIIPNEKNDEEPYVIFTDYTLDTNDDFIKQYGKLVKEKDVYYIDTNLSDKEIEYIKEQSEEDIIKYVNDALEENLDDEN